MNSIFLILPAASGLLGAMASIRARHNYNSCAPDEVNEERAEQGVAG
jgi:hypothetical protein